MSDTTRSITAVIFDMDGLLIDSEPIWAEAEARLLAGRGITFDQEFSKLFFGRWISDALKGMQEQFGLQGDLDQLAREWAEHFCTICAERLPLRPGANEIIRHLHGRVPMAIASSSPRRVIDQVVRTFQWDRYIRGTRAGEEVQNGKPAPDIFLAAAALLGVEPARCLVLEDSPAGVRAAKAAGMHCLAVPSREFFPLEAFAEADAICDTLFAASAAIDRL